MTFRQAKHPSFDEPEDVKAKIWRYLDLAKFLSMLEKSALYFCRVDLLGDPFEGSRPRGEDAFWADLVDRGEVKIEVAEHNSDAMNYMRRKSRQRMYANCWHLNEQESAAMWHLYARDAASIAVQSTFHRLRQSLPEKIHIGIVKYIDYQTESVPFGSGFSYFLHKRKSFEHERELRALIWTEAISKGELEWDTSPEQLGIEVPIRLTELLEQIVIAPQAPSWFRDLVVQIIRRYDLQLVIRDSNLSAKPDV